MILWYVISMDQILYFNSNFQLPNPVDFVKAYLSLKGENQKISRQYGFGENSRKFICEYFNLKEEITEENIDDFIHVFRKYIKSGKIDFTKEQFCFLSKLIHNSVLGVEKEILPLTIKLYLEQFKDIIYCNIKGNFLNFYLKKWHKLDRENFDLETFLEFFFLDKDKKFVKLFRQINNFEGFLAILLLVFLLALTVFIANYFHLE